MTRLRLGSIGADWRRCMSNSGFSRRSTHKTSHLRTFASINGHKANGTVTESAVNKLRKPIPPVAFTVMLNTRNKFGIHAVPRLALDFYKLVGRFNGIQQKLSTFVVHFCIEKIDDFQIGHGRDKICYKFTKSVGRINVKLVHAQLTNRSISSQGLECWSDEILRNFI